MSAQTTPINSGERLSARDLAELAELFEKFVENTRTAINDGTILAVAASFQQALPGQYGEDGDPMVHVETALYGHTQSLIALVMHKIQRIFEILSGNDSDD